MCWSCSLHELIPFSWATHGPAGSHVNRAGQEGDQCRQWSTRSSNTNQQRDSQRGLRSSAFGHFQSAAQLYHVLLRLPLLFWWHCVLCLLFTSHTWVYVYFGKRDISGSLWFDVNKLPYFQKACYKNSFSASHSCWCWKLKKVWLFLAGTVLDQFYRHQWMIRELLTQR